jgi:hypothetical protein
LRRPDHCSAAPSIGQTFLLARSPLQETAATTTKPRKNRVALRVSSRTFGNCELDPPPHRINALGSDAHLITVMPGKLF